ncbi:MAG: uracil-DNA glycosylase [Gammaproteobacteria bacterium]|nr:uracil-DNA glycosylase [Gammaproteobacteria bacterium]
MSEAARRAAYLGALGIDQWVPRRAVAVPAPLTAPVPAPAVASSVDGWSALEACVRDCVRCPLHRGRTQTVFGSGARRAEWMVVGEAPGAEEDRQGEPFVGPAGQLLTAMLGAIGLARDSVFIANVLKCRPPENRDPKPEEVAECLPYLAQQVELVRPRLILAFGRVAAQNLLGTEATLGSLRGTVHRFGPLNTPVVVTYHPAYLLRSPGEKRKAWEDLKFARQVHAGLPAAD